MKSNRALWIQLLVLAGLVLFSVLAAQADDPCAGVKRRALVLSGGGSKGAFETGAIYHLVVQRRCDISEFSGVSVGALNSAFLAQAAESDDPADSLSNLAEQAEGLVDLWQSLKSSNDIRKKRLFATVRFGLFGLESLNDFGPLRRLLDRSISTEKLAKGRPVRIGVVSFWGGGYREVLAQPLLARGGGKSFLDYLYASSIPPVYGKLPRIPDGMSGDDPKLWPQFSDGGVRHITPVSSYFKICKPGMPGPNGLESAPEEENCASISSFPAAPHAPLQQLFVIVTSPYSRDSDLLPPMDASCCRPGRHQITDGRKILGRTLALMDDAVYRSDLDFLLFANDMLRWRSQAYQQLVLNSDPGQLADRKRQFFHGQGFAVESYNRNPLDSAAPSLPYDIGLITPERELADPEHLLAISPAIVAEQLHAGCLAADQMMQRDFNLSSLADQCEQRFPPAGSGTGKALEGLVKAQTTPAGSIERSLSAEAPGEILCKGKTIGFQAGDSSCE